MAASGGQPHSFKFSSPDGYSLCQKILASHLPYDPHDYQLEGVCKALDGIDVLAVTPTGSGKTGFLTMYLVVMREILKDSSLCPVVKFKPDPAMVMVCPTKSLEVDMQPKFDGADLTSIIINSDTVEAAHREGRDLWVAARKGVTIILLSPEQLKSPGFRSLVDNKAFGMRVVAFAVDEVHLINTWGASFRPIFTHIGHGRAMLPGKPVLFALMATLRPGTPTLNVCDILGLRKGQYHHIRRSNSRHDIQLIFRDMQSSSRGLAFPELDWVLDSNRKIILFCTTINLGFHVTAYLWHRASNLPDRKQRVRLYNSLNWPEYNDETLGFMHHDNRSRVTIATDTLCVGINAAQTEDVVIYGDIPKDVDDILQKAGRIREGWSKGSRAFIYMPRSVHDAAQKAVDAGEEVAKLRGKKRKKEERGALMDLNLARLILSKCKVDELDRIYGNPTMDKACTCRTCKENPPIPRPQACTCSGCQPEAVPVLVPKPKPTKPSVPASMRVTRAMCTIATKRLINFRESLWEMADEVSFGMVPSELFLPDDLIKTLLDHFNDLTATWDVVPLIYRHRFLTVHHGKLWNVILELREVFDRIRTEANMAKNAKRREIERQRREEKRAKMEAVFTQAELSMEEGSSEEEDEETSDEEPLAVVHTRL